jgi:ABC-type sugar transport system permease subunit
VQTIERIEEKIEYRYLPEGEQYYDSTVYQNEDGDFLLWLVGRDDGALLIATQDSVAAVTPEQSGLDGVELSADDDEAPPTLDGYQQLQLAELNDAIDELAFSFPLTSINIIRIDDPQALGEGYFFDPAQILFVDNTGRSPTLFNATVYRSEDERFALWLVEDGGGSTILARPDSPVVVDGLPQTIADFQILNNRERLAVANQLPDIEFGAEDDPLFVDAFSANRVGRFGQIYEYDDAQDAFVDRVTGAVYRPDVGTFILDPASVDEDIAADLPAALSPGYYVVIGLDNFERLLTNERLFAPFVRIFIWTITHAFFSVLLTFTMGLALALLMNDTHMPQRKLLRSLILIPYAIPAFISTVVWRGMFDPNLGIINEALEPLFGSAPNWYTDGNAARFAILMIQMWLGFPYMMLICTGALQALPSDIYEAAEVDGASAFQRFRRITLPLLLVAVGPLLIASFAFNFNNFTVIELFNSGGPAIANSAVPAGHTDILITYTYAQAFGGDGGADYALASAISVFIFIIVAAITIFNFRFTKSWEAVSENV